MEALEDPAAAQCEEETSGWSLEPSSVVQQQPPPPVPLPRLSIKQAEQQSAAGGGDVFKKAKAGMTVGASQDNISILD